MTPFRVFPWEASDEISILRMDKECRFRREGQKQVFWSRNAKRLLGGRPAMLDFDAASGSECNKRPCLRLHASSDSHCQTPSWHEIHSRYFSSQKYTDVAYRLEMPVLTEEAGFDTPALRPRHFGDEMCDLPYLPRDFRNSSNSGGGKDLPLIPL